MTVKDCICVLLSKAGLTQEEFAHSMGLKSRASISVPLSRSDGMGMKVETLIRWLDVLEADLVIQPREGDLDDEMLLYEE